MPTANFTSKFKSKRQLKALAITKFEREPKSYREAMESANRTNWQVAMEDQYKSLIEKQHLDLGQTIRRSTWPPNPQWKMGI